MRKANLSSYIAKAGRRILFATACGYLGGLILWPIFIIVGALQGGHAFNGVFTFKDIFVLLVFPAFPIYTGNIGFLLFVLIVFLFPIPNTRRETLEFLLASAIAGFLGLVLPPVWSLVQFFLLPGPLGLEWDMGWRIWTLGIGTALLAGAIYLWLVRRSISQRILRAS